MVWICWRRLNWVVGYINNFSHDCYLIKDKNSKDGFNYSYFDKIVLKNNKSRIKKTRLFIPDKEDYYELLLQNGYNVKKIYNFNEFSELFYEVAILKVGPKTINVEMNDLKTNPKST